MIGRSTRQRLVRHKASSSTDPASRWVRATHREREGAGILCADDEPASHCVHRAPTGACWNGGASGSAWSERSVMAFDAGSYLRGQGERLVGGRAGDGQLGSSPLASAAAALVAVRALSAQEAERVLDEWTRMCGSPRFFTMSTFDRLRAAYWALEPKAAPGVDGVTWQDYGQDLEENLRDLHARVHRGAYRARPSRGCTSRRRTDIGDRPR